jgi:hypothetical protein
VSDVVKMRSDAPVTRFGSAAIIAMVAGGLLPACELFVGTDDFVTSADAGGTNTSNGSGKSGSSSSSGSSNSSTTVADAGVDRDSSIDDGGGPGSDSGGKSVLDGGDAAVDSGGGTGVCASATGDPTCTACWKEACCSAYTACQADSDCLSIVTCIESCPLAPCNCTGTAQGLQLFGAMAECGALAQTTDCDNCAASGSGDQCDNSSNCVGGGDAGLQCLYDGYQAFAAFNNDSSCTPTTCAGWCSPNTCSFDSDCTGNFANGVSENGQGDVCIVYDSNGDTMCFPLCGHNNSCAGVPGTSCSSDIDIEGNSVMACE